MSEVARREEVSHHKLLRNYTEELQSQIDEEGGDPYFKACYQAQIEALEVNPDFKKVLEDYLWVNHERTPSYHGNHIARALQYMVLGKASRYDYPHAWNQPYLWGIVIQEVSKPGSRGRARFEESLTWPLASNVARRALPLAALLGKMRQEGRVGDEVNVLEVGCSQMQLLTKLAILHSGPVDKVTAEKKVTRYTEDDKPYDAYEFDEHGTLVLERWLESAPNVRGTGTDILDAYDPVIRDWARSNSLRPKDLVDNGGVLAEAYDLLEASRPDSIRFHQADFSKLSREDRKALMDGDGYDVVFFPTINNQIGRRNERIFNQNADRFVKKDGIVVEQDFSVPDPTDPSRMLRYQHWFRDPHAYGLSARRADDPEKKYHHIMTADTSRCERLIINKESLERFLMKRVIELGD